MVALLGGKNQGQRSEVIVVKSGLGFRPRFARWLHGCVRQTRLHSGARLQLRVEASQLHRSRPDSQLNLTRAGEEQRP